MSFAQVLPMMTVLPDRLTTQARKRVLRAGRRWTAPSNRVRRLTPHDMASADPLLLSLQNLNTPADYREALATAGMPLAD